MKKTFYSNCLLEAIKAKLKNWKSIDIIYLPKELAFQSQFGHFLWRNNKTDEYFHFTRNGLPSEHYCSFLFKGFVEQITKHDVEKQADSELKRRAHKWEAKYGIQLELMRKERVKVFDSWTSWNLMNDSNNLPCIDNFYANGGTDDLAPIVLATCYSQFGMPYQKLFIVDKNTNKMKPELLQGEKIAMWRWSPVKSGDLIIQEIENFNKASDRNRLL